MVCLLILDIIFHRAEVLNFEKVQFIIFFCHLYVYSISKMSLPRVIQVFSYAVFQGFCSFEFYIYVHIHFELIFIERSVFRIIFTGKDIQFSQHHFLKGVFLLHCTCICSFTKDESTVFMGPLFQSIILFSVILPILQYLDYYSITVSLEVEQCQSSTFILFLHYCLSYSEPFTSSYNDYNKFVNIHKKLAEIFLIGIALNLYVKLGRIDILSILSLLFIERDYHSLYLVLL